MVQTVNSILLPPGQQKIFLEKPRVLRRIFFRITALLPLTANYQSNVSFDDPMFYTFYALMGPTTYFEASGEGIYQGNVWVRNASTVSIYYAVSEILIE